MKNLKFLINKNRCIVAFYLNKHVSECSTFEFRNMLNADKAFMYLENFSNVFVHVCKEYKIHNLEYMIELDRVKLK
jgi:hypothetical protein